MRWVLNSHIRYLMIIWNLQYLGSSPERNHTRFPGIPVLRPCMRAEWSCTHSDPCCTKCEILTLRPHRMFFKKVASGLCQLDNQKGNLFKGLGNRFVPRCFVFFPSTYHKSPPLVISEKANESLGSCVSQQCAHFSGMKTWTGFTEPTWKDVGHSVHFAIPALRRRRQEDCWSSLACLVGEFPVS